MNTRQALFISVLLVLHASPATADPRGAAKKAWSAGAADYDAGRYQRAIEKFKESYELYPSPNTVFSLGQAYRKAGDDSRAIECYRRYLRDRVDAPNRELVEGLIRQLEESNPSLREPPPTPPVPVPVPVPVPDPAPAPAPAPSPSPSVSPSPWTSDPLGLSLAGTGLVATGVGITLLAISAARLTDASVTIDEQSALDRRSSARTLRTAGFVTTALGGAALGAGLVKLFVLPRPPARERGLSWSVTPGGILLLGSF